MSDTTPDDPMLALLRERRAALLREADDINVRVSEIDTWLNQLADGRSRVNRKRRTGVAPPPTQPGGYADSVSLGELRGILVRQDDERGAP